MLTATAASQHASHAAADERHGGDNADRCIKAQGSEKKRAHVHVRKPGLPRSPPRHL